MMSRERFFFLDLLKAISIVSVVSFHAVFVPTSTYESSAVFLETLFSPLRFCVPTFLLISFFLLEHSLEKSASSKEKSKQQLIKTRLSRLAVPAGFWFTLCAVTDLIRGFPVQEILYRILRGEAFTGAYYFIILFQLIPLAIFLKDKWIKSALTLSVIIGLQICFFAVILHFSSVSSKSPELAQSLAFIRSFGRPVVLYWLAYPFLGGWLYKKLNALSTLSVRMPLWTKFSLLTILILSFTVEQTRLLQLFPKGVPPFEYFMVSCLLSGPILFLCCVNMQYHDLPPWLRTPVMLLSKYSLGIFCLNGLLSRWLLFAGAKLSAGYTFTLPEMLMLKLVGWLVLLALSLAGSFALSNIGLKKMVC